MPERYDASRDESLRARNRRTGWILAAVALLFFVGVIVKYVIR